MNVTAMTVQEKILTLGGMAPVASQSSIAAPKRGCEVIHARSLGEPLPKQKAARSTSGVVGRIGRNAPMIPMASAISPAAVQRCRTCRE